ncbi:PAS domain S-box protein [Halarcobacter sp.]|uniref:PAS domain-containing sensor histidine kinase n=1 Tax=Halarcobacter sp. TaxID=2321133 RepID=UPI002AAA7FB3|nr:PAS domain S-box protein [Halarcobacter sp.]
MPYNLQELSKLDKNLLHLLTEHLPDMLWIKDLHGYYIYANKAICEGLLMAKDINEPIGKNDVFFAMREREAHKENPKWHTFGELCFNSDQVVIDTNKPMKFEEWGNVKGKLLYLEVNKAPFYDDEGNIIGTVGSGRDITQLKLTQLELSKQAQIIEQIHDSIITSDKCGNIITWNKSSEKLFGYKVEEIRGKNINIIFPEELQEKIKSFDLKDLENNSFEKKVKLTNKSSEILTCMLSLSFFKEKNSEKDRMVYYIKDISDEEKLSEENKHQERIINIQSQHVAMGQMIGNIAHQWRQPLSVISAATTGVQIQKALGTLSDESLENSYNSINMQVQYLSNTINTFRDFIKEEKVYKEVILQERVDKSLELLDAALVGNHIELINNIDYSVPLKVRLISGEISQVIINIVSNAKDILIENNIKKPWIKINLKTKKNKAILSFEDNGGGIPLEIIDKVFEPYFTTKHKSIGTGLGLYMSYKIVVESLSGKLYTKNTQNGAKFYIELPLID